MKKSMLKVITMLSLVVGLAASSVWGASEYPFKINIPFEFTAGKQTLPAGEYVVRQVSGSSIVRIQSVDHQAIALVQTNSVQERSGRSTARLVFRRYGEEYFLSRVFDGNDSDGRELPRSRRERELIKSQSNHIARQASGAEVVEIAAQ